MINKHHIKPNFVQIHPKNQKNDPQPKHLKIKKRFTICKKIRSLKSNFLARCNTMERTPLLYFRVKSDTIMPKLVYWYINRQFSKGTIPNVLGFLVQSNITYFKIPSNKNLSGHILLGSLVEKVEDKSYANFSIGTDPHNFGDMELLCDEYITVKR